MTAESGASYLAARLAAAAAALLLLASCASAPKRSPPEWMGVLPSDATLYVSISVPQSADLIRRTLKQGGPAYNDVAQLADRTSRVVLSMTLGRDEPMRFAAVALGSYPAFLINLSLSGKKEWKQVSAVDGSYFLFNKANLQLSIPNGGILLASNGAMPMLLSRYKTPVPLPIPPEVKSDMTRTDVVLYMPQLPGGIGQPAPDQPAAMESDERPHLAIREVWVDATKTKEGYLLVGTMNTGTEEQARVLALVLKIGIVAWMKSNDVTDVADRLRAISVIPEGTSVKVNGISVSDQEIIPLFLGLLNGPSAAEGAQAAPTGTTSESGN
ncbi:MAG TPA: hypothetical protein VMU36_11170 [Spirochaetia bacterium]|nr:hypothetical protein [Spirochaetia bacterium]